MFLEVERHGPGQLVVTFEQQEMRPPAGAGDSAARVLQRRQEFVADEGVVTGETVPFIRSHGIERIDHMYFDLAVQQAYLASGLFGLSAGRLVQRGTVILAEVAGFCSKGFVAGA